MLITSLIVLGAVLYTLIAIFALLMTYAERARSGARHPFFVLLSTLACAAWPVTVVVVALTAVAMQRRPVAAPIPTKAQTAN